MSETGVWVALVAGLLGGGHCLGMCGGIVAAMSLSTGRRPGMAILLGYNLGRVASYTLAGALAGLIGAAAFLSDTLFPLQRGLYMLAQIMLILIGLYLAGLNTLVLRLEAVGGRLWTHLQPRLGRLLPIRDFRGAVAAGALWGWLPCGLVYSVLVSALASGGAASGAALMLAFGLGTLPNLLAMGWGAVHLRRLMSWRPLKLAAGLTVAGLGVWGLLRPVLH